MRMNEGHCSTARSKWMSALAGAVAIGFLAVATLGATPKAPPYLPLNVHVGQKAPDFALPAAGGGMIRLSQFQGHNVLLDFYEGYW